MSNVNDVLLNLRREFSGQPLKKSDLSDNPFEQFSVWFANALKSEVNEPNAMTAATADSNGFPSARVVLLRSFDSEGFVFYTNYNSNKGIELLKNPKVCLNFFWPELARQIRIKGIAVKVPFSMSDEYFAGRPRDSQIGAWASEQSKVIRNREILDERFSQFKLKFSGKAITRPPQWGGFRVNPDLFEFWQGREIRLHDRIQYIKGKDGDWIKERLAP